MDLAANLKFGFDTSGIATGNLLDGFFLDFRDGRPLFRFEGELRAEARLGSSFQVPELGLDVTLAGAGAYWRNNLRLTPRTGPDGKMRFTQIVRDWDRGLGCVFDAAGGGLVGADFVSRFRVHIGPFEVEAEIPYARAEAPLYDFQSICAGVTSNVPPGFVPWIGVGGSTNWDDPVNWAGQLRRHRQHPGGLRHRRHRRVLLLRRPYHDGGPDAHRGP